MLSDKDINSDISSDVKIKNKTQWIVGIELFLFANTLGLMIGWTVSALPNLMLPSSPIIINKNDASWIASSSDIGRTIGAIIGAIISSIYGTKTSLTWVGIIEAFGFLIQAIAYTVDMIIASRLITGFALGMSNVIVPLYIGEISNPNYRGTLSGLRNVGMNFGQILGNVLGDKLSLSEFSLFVCIFIFIFLSSFYWLPKSPYYFIKKNKDKKAFNAVKFYRPDVNCENELETLKSYVNNDKSLTFYDVLYELIKSQNIISLIKIIIIVLLLQFSGQYTMSYYSGIILNDYKNKTIIIATMTALSFIASIIGMLTNDKFERKYLLGVSSLFVALSLVTLGVYYVIIDKNIFSDNILSCLLVGSLIVRKIFLSYGVSICLGTYMSEIFAQNVKFISLCIVNIVSGLTASISTKIYQPLYDIIDYNIYFLYGAFMIALSIYAFLFLPKTNGKSLQEIQEMLKK
ncbi:hypothetical protein HCN44_001033 [Aphidius gifuensis]|uniref:Major facilitator superfamily (MFS) profile domain-containing protein n=2 Tax=Aphidius gifuensis TaxID=684658 RepID=A0A835CPU8_APHGI|nr:hypothetical protein HCN44_001033 [Aphidius gifuensis]